MAAINIPWTRDQWGEVFGYLANSRTELRIEIQVPHGGRFAFEARVQTSNWANPSTSGEFRLFGFGWLFQ